MSVSEATNVVTNVVTNAVIVKKPSKRETLQKKLDELDTTRKSNYEEYTPLRNKQRCIDTEHNRALIAYENARKRVEEIASKKRETDANMKSITNNIISRISSKNSNIVSTPFFPAVNGDSKIIREIFRNDFFYSLSR